MASKNTPEILDFNPCGFSFNEDFTVCTLENGDGEGLDIKFPRAPRNEGGTNSRVRKMARLCGRVSQFLKRGDSVQWIAFVGKEETVE